MIQGILKFRIPIAPKGGRDNNFDFLRFFLAIVVIYCHCHVLYYGTEDTVEPLWEASMRQISMGSMSVNFFFVISGYLILQSWQKTLSFGEYIKKRILRIYPGFFMAALLCLFLLAPLGTADHYQPFGYWQQYFSEIDYVAFFQNILLLQELTVPDTLKYVPIANTINASLWTIRYEFICYLLVPLLHIFGVFRSRYVLFIIFILCMTLLYMQDHHEVTLWSWEVVPFVGKPDFFPRFFAYFLAGMCFNHYRVMIPRSLSLWVVSLIGTALGLFVFKGLNIVLPIFGSYILFYVAFTQRFTLKNFSKYGDFSYGLYVYAWPIQQLIVLHLERHLNMNLLFILTILITIPIAWLSWHYIEKPFLHSKPREWFGIHKIRNVSLFGMRLS